jgi:TonB-dependent receptor
VTGGGETTFSFAGRTPAFTEQIFTFNDGLPIAARSVAGNSNYSFSPAELGTQVLRINYQDQVTDITQARLDGVLEFEDSGSLQFGIETRSMEMTQRGSENFMTLGNWGVASPGEIPAELLTPFSLTGEFDDFSTDGAPVDGWKGNANDLAAWAMGPYGTWRDAAANNPNDSLQYNPGFNQNNTVEEETKSVYFQFNLKGELGAYPYNFQAGVRYEETDVTSISALLIPTAIGWEDNNDFFVTRETTFTPFAQDAEYDHVLPSLDFDMDLTDSFKARFSYSKTIARAAYNQLRSSVSVGTPQGSTINSFLPSATGSNPALVPLESDNLDLSFEYYFGESSYLSAGFFEKRVSNFIGNEVVQENLFGIRNQTGGPRAQAARTELVNRGFATNDTNLFVMMAMMENPGGANGQDVGGAAAFDGTEAQHLRIATAFDLLPAADDPLYTFNVTRPVNNREAKLYGVELAGQHFFGDSGFGVQANYTIVNGDVAFDDAGDPNITQFALLGLSDSANFVAMYEKFGLSVRLAYNWRDEFLQNNARGGFRNPEYVEAYDQIDLNVGYNFNDHLSVSLEAINLTGEDIRWHGRSDLQMWLLEDQGPRYAFGARYKF